LKDLPGLRFVLCAPRQKSHWTIRFLKIFRIDIPFYPLKGVEDGKCFSQRGKKCKKKPSRPRFTLEDQAAAQQRLADGRQHLAARKRRGAQDEVYRVDEGVAFLAAEAAEGEFGEEPG
jgi:hypothetical protein